MGEHPEKQSSEHDLSYEDPVREKTIPSMYANRALYGLTVHTFLALVKAKAFYC